MLLPLTAVATHLMQYHQSRIVAGALKGVHEIGINQSLIDHQETNVFVLNNMKAQRFFDTPALKT